MAILYDSTRRVKVVKTRFGHGLLASRPTHRLPVSLADLDWAAAAFAPDGGQLWDEDVELEVRAAEAEALARIEAGHLL